MRGYRVAKLPLANARMQGESRVGCPFCSPFPVGARSRSVHPENRRFFMRATRKAILAAVLPPLFLLTACGDDATPARLTEPTGPRLDGAAAQQVPPISVEPLTGRHVFTDDVAVQIRNRPDRRRATVVNLQDGTHLAVLKITVQPGARFPWHTHPGPVAVAVAEGEMTYVYADDCVRRPYPQTAFIDPGFDNIHMAFNSSETDVAVLIATFFGVPAAGPLTLAVSAEAGAALDAKCGFAAAAHAH
jgi:hypothetical protein